MWAEIEVQDYRDRTLRLRYEERTGEWSAQGDSAKLSTAGTIELVCQIGSAGIPAADSRRALTAAKMALDALEKDSITNGRRGKLVAHGEWPWPVGWWPVTEEERRLRDEGKIIVA